MKYLSDSDFRVLAEQSIAIERPEVLNFPDDAIARFVAHKTAELKQKFFSTSPLHTF